MGSKPFLTRRKAFIAAGALGTTAALRRQGLISSAAAAGSELPPYIEIPRLQPFLADPNQIADIKVCIRPFRAAGPRQDVERIGDKTVFHNYGHGGSGWSLSWGSANIVIGKVATTLEKKVAVIGCGIIGLTSALTAQRAGCDVTIYTRDTLPHTRSVRANGSWTPDSRIALTKPAGPAFADLWEQMARFSWATYRGYLGLPGAPIDFSDHYVLSDKPMTAEDIEKKNAGKIGKGDYASTGMPQSSSEFAEYSDRITDIIPQAETIRSGEVPFGVAYGKRQQMMMYNFGAYGHLLLSEFFQAGGKIVNREFHSPEDLKSLPEKVVVNCPGYAAREWWNDKSLIPVRGQTTWLPPRPDLRYGMVYNGSSMLSKSDGIMIQGFDLELGEMAGVGNSFEHPDRSESERAIGVFTELFNRNAVKKG